VKDRGLAWRVNQAVIVASAAVYRFDIRLQGDDETVFFDV